MEGDILRISNEKGLKKLGFGIFLSFFYSNISPKYAWRFVKLDTNHVLFIRTMKNSLSKTDSFHYVEDPFHKIPTGNLHCKPCPIKHWMLYNIGILETDKDIKNSITYEIEEEPIKDGGRCYDCKRGMINWIKKKICENETYGKLLGGDICLLDVKSDFFKFFYTPHHEKMGSLEQSPKIDKDINLEESLTHEQMEKEVVRDEIGDLDPIEVLFNSFLVLYFGGKIRCPVIGANAKMRSPFEAHELDGYLWDHEKKKLIVIETSREMRIDKKHLKHKIYNSVLMDLLEHTTYKYLYITLGNKSRDFRENAGHAELVKKLKDQYKVPFTIIDLPQKYDKAKENFDSELLKEIYEHYLNSIEKTIKIVG